MEDRVVIRTARSGDAEALGDVTLAGWEGATVGERLRERHACLEAYDWREEKRGQVEGFAREHPEWALVAEVAGRVVGYATYTFNGETWIGEIGNNAVHPEFRGRGIGRALQEEALARLRGAGMKAARVTTLVTSGAARKMYERARYVEIARSITYSQEL